MSDEQVSDILGQWRDRRDGGEAVDPEEVIRAHPELADALRARFKAIAELERHLGASRPETIGGYRILREIGRGGMGVVYEAEQIAMRRRVALKVLYPSVTSVPKAVKRFQQEAWAAGKLKHTNIVAVHELGQDRGVWYAAMELVEGRPLNDVIADLRRSRRRPRESRLGRRVAGGETRSSFAGTETGTRAYYARVAEMFAAVAEALQVAHDHGVIHRDLKPGNLLLDVEGNLKLVDFGLARLEGLAAMTMTGDVVGTPYYMSPEQISGGRGGLDHRTDVYSLGVTLYETLALRPPFRGETVQAVAGRVLDEDPVSPRRWDRSIPRDLETIVLKALEKAPARRYRSAGDLAADLRQFAQGGPIRARRIGLLGRGWRKVKRHKVPSALLAAVVMLGVVAGWVAVERGREAEVRRRLEYDALCRRADETAMAEWGLPEEIVWGAGPGRAHALYGEAIALDPGRVQAYLGRALLRQGDSFDGATADIAAARERGLPQRTAHLAYAFLLAQAGAWAEAAREEELAAGLPRAGPMDACLEGWILARRGRWEAAEPLLSEAIRLAPASDTVHFVAVIERAVSRERLGNLEGALEDWLVARRLGRDETLESRVRVASLWRRLDKEDRGQELFDQVLSEVATRGSEESWYALWVACATAREPAWADRVTAAGLEVHPESLRLAHGRLDSLMDLARHDEVLTLAQRILEKSPDDRFALNQKGNILARRDLHEEALACYERALGEAPRSPGLLTNKSVVLHGLGRDREALEAVEAAIAAAPGFARAYAARAKVLAGLHRPEEALAVADEAVRIDPQLPWAHASRAAVLNEMRRFADAAEAAARALDLDPRYVDAHNSRGLALRGLGRHEEALGAFERAIEIKPTSATFWDNKARLLAEVLGRPQEAADAYRKLLEHVPPGQGMHAEGTRANALFFLGEYAQALRLYEEVTRLAPGDVRAHTNKGNVLKLLGNLEDALAAHRRAVELGPDTAYCHSNLGTTLQAMAEREGDPARRDQLHREALASYERALALEPALPEAIYNRASCLGALGEIEKAILGYDRYIELAPADPDGPVRKAGLLERQGKREDALVILDEVIQRHPDHEPAYRARADLCIALYRFAQAAADYTRVLDMGPADRTGLRLNRGVCMRALGRLEESRADLEYATASGLWQAWTHLAITLEEMERHEEAFGTFRRSLEVAPHPFTVGLLGRFHAGCPDARWRDPARGVELARRAVAEAPGAAWSRELLGTCLCRAGRWEDGIAELRRSMDLEGGGSAGQWFWVAMASWHVGRKDEANEWFEKAVRWMEETTPHDPALKRLRGEAARLIGRDG